NVGQVASIRTLEKQMRRMGASTYAEVRSITDEMRRACQAPPSCVWDESSSREPIAPTLAKYADQDTATRDARARVAEWAAQNVRFDAPKPDGMSVDLVRPGDPLDEAVATLLYAAVASPFRTV